MTMFGGCPTRVVDQWDALQVTVLEAGKHLSCLENNYPLPSLLQAQNGPILVNVACMGPRTSFQISMMSDLCHCSAHHLEIQFGPA
jgi:hypothetical protein